MPEGDAPPRSPTREICGLTAPNECTGTAVADFGRCLAHLPPERRASYLTELERNSGVDLDCTGTTFTREVLQEVLSASGGTVSNTGVILGGHVLRSINFTEATFSEDVSFDYLRFQKEASFAGAKFSGKASFCGTQFQQDVSFRDCVFSESVDFSRANFNQFSRFEHTTFKGSVSFISASFAGYTLFDGVEVDGPCDFTRATFRAAVFQNIEFADQADFGNADFQELAHFNDIKFGGQVQLGRATFRASFIFKNIQADGLVWLNGTRFHMAESLGPLICHSSVIANGVVFDEAIVLEIAAPYIWLTRAKFSSTATVWVRYAQVDLSGVVLAAPLEVITSPIPYSSGGQESIDEGSLGSRSRQETARIASISRVDASHLVLTNVDLSSCTFTGAYHLDTLRIEGSTNFGHPPSGWHFHGKLPMRWSRRQTLREEHHWRAACDRFGPGWINGEHISRPTVEPRALAAIYRSLRKSLEDRGDAPGAADFYYGEMEMRRHDHSTTKQERGLLHLYWLLSGYGLRATRALCALALLMTITVLFLLMWGLPAATPEPVTSGTVNATGKVTMTTNTPALVLPNWGERFTGERVNTAIPIVFQAVVFRASDTNLTTRGVYIDMIARVLEPSLLALAVLAVRGRVKR